MKVSTWKKTWKQPVHLVRIRVGVRVRVRVRIRVRARVRIRVRVGVGVRKQPVHQRERCLKICRRSSGASPVVSTWPW